MPAISEVVEDSQRSAPAQGGRPAPESVQAPAQGHRAHGSGPWSPSADSDAGDGSAAPAQLLLQPLQAASLLSEHLTDVDEPLAGQCAHYGKRGRFRVIRSWRQCAHCVPSAPGPLKLGPAKSHPGEETALALGPRLPALALVTRCAGNAHDATWLCWPALGLITIRPTVTGSLFASRSWPEEKHFSTRGSFCHAAVVLATGQKAPSHMQPRAAPAVA